MHTTLTAPSRHEHPPQQLAVERHVGLVDRLALRVGLALLVWARRPRKVVAQNFLSQAELAELREARYSSHHLLTLIR